MAKLLLVALLAILPLPMVHGQGTPLLFLGPGGYSNESEVFSLPPGWWPTSSCTVPEHPVPDIEGYVAFVQDGYLQLCGGYSSYNGGSQSSCYALRDSASVATAWVATTPLTSARHYAAAITFPNGSVLISGGVTTDGTYLSSSEILTGTTWAPALELPSARRAHCLLALSTGEVFLHGGLTTGYNRVRDTHLSTDLTSWQSKASSGIGRSYPACTEVTLGTEQEVWVGGYGSTEIYSVATDAWRTGPALPSIYHFPGQFVSYNDQLYYADGHTSKYIYQLEAWWTPGGSGWDKVGEMSGKRRHYQAMIISQDICQGLGDMTIGKKIKRTPLNVTFTPDGSLAYVSGSLASVVTNLASASPTPVNVSCCAGGTGAITTQTTCGNGISCTNICGGNSTGCITLKLEESAAEDQVCGASMDQHDWCGNADTIKGLTSVTSECRRKRRQTDTTMKPPTACTVCTTTIADLWYCPTVVKSNATIGYYPLCCMHPDTRGIPGVPLFCCTDHKACF